MLNFLIILLITMSIIFYFMKHPLSMGFILILQTINISLITGLMIKNYWFSFILLITMLSGALVLFIYMASVASNEKFSSSIMAFYMTLSLVTMALGLSFFMDIISVNMWDSIKISALDKNDQVISLIKMFNMHNMYITIMIVMYLFLTMIVISYIVDVFEGPLRTKN